MKLNDPSSLLPDLPHGAEILIVRPRSLGDIVLETPAIAALHVWRPDLRIFILIEPKYAPALEGNPGLSGVFFLRGFLKTAALLRQRRFPVFFNQHGGPRSALLTAASRAPARVGWKGFQYDSVYNVRVPDAAEFYGKPLVHTVEHRLSQFYCTGLPRGPIPAAQIFPRREATERMRKMRVAWGMGGAETPYAVLQPEARTPAMRWPAERFAQIARWLRDRHGMTSVVNLAASEPAVAAEIRAALGSSAAVPDPVDLGALIALIGGARLFIGNDSGPVHLAAAMRTPSVVLYGPTNPVQWRPWQTEHRVVSAGAEFRAIRGDKSIAVGGPSTVGSIAVDAVRAACEELIAEGNWRRPHEVPGGDSKQLTSPNGA